MARYKDTLAGTLAAVLATLVAVGPVAAQHIDQGLGKVNPFGPLIDPKTGQPTKPFEIPTPSKPVPDPNLFNNAYPTQPWNQLGVYRQGYGPYGSVVQYITVPSQAISVSLFVPVPDGVPPRTEERVVQVPGYYIAETTTGYYYPERWTLRQLNVGVYQWLRLPAEFRPKTIQEVRPPTVIK